MKNSNSHSFWVFTYKLNRSLILAMLLTFASISEAAAAPGLFQRLIKIKYSSELYLIIKAKEAAKLNKPDMVDSALAVYNTIRWNFDGLVYQLSGDLVVANSPKLIRRLDFQTLESIESLCTIYLPAFSLINEMPAEENQEGTRNINLTTNVFYLIKDSYSLIKGLSDLKTQKTMALVDILDQMRLTSPQELLKQVK